MRARSRWWWVLWLAMLAFVGWSAGCAVQPDGRANSTEDSGAEPDPDEDDPLLDTSESNGPCAGACLAEPPAPFNSKVHLIWRGLLGLGGYPPACPESAPLPGLLAEVISVEMNGQPQRAADEWVRECLISTSAAVCPASTTCVPPPPADYDLCISRESDGPCPAAYYPEHIVVQEPGEPAAAPVTLCCMGEGHIQLTQPPYLGR